MQRILAFEMMKEEAINGLALLIKFKNERIIDSLQSGCVYMNSLEVFRKMEADSEENDEVADPVDGLWHMHDAYVYTEDFSEPPIHVVDAGIQTKHSNDFCYCFFGIDEKHYVEQFNEKQKQKFLEIGDTALIVTDLPQFLERVKKAAIFRGYEFNCDFVEYYDPKVDSINLQKIFGKDGLKHIAYRKKDIFSYQQEFRITVHAPDVKEDHIVLNIGDISGITTKKKTIDVLNARFGKKVPQA